MKRNYFLIGALMIAVVLVATLISHPYLPARVPGHWNPQGQVDRYYGKWVLFMHPGIMVGIMLMFAALPWLSPRRFEVDTFQTTYLYLMLVLVGFFGYLQALLLWAAFSKPLRMSHALMAAMYLLFALIGNVLGKVQRNFYIGVRTPWTLANERVWYATHRFAAKAFVIAGLLGFLTLLAGVRLLISLTLLLAAAIACVVYSLAYYKYLERRGEL